jgi:hypothetical protein
MAFPRTSPPGDGAQLGGEGSLLGAGATCAWVSDAHFVIQLGYRAALSSADRLAFNAARLVYTVEVCER